VSGGKGIEGTERPTGSVVRRSFNGVSLTWDYPSGQKYEKKYG